MGDSLSAAKEVFYGTTLMLSQKASRWMAKQKAPNARRAIGKQ
jgi:hypothetical protein